MENVAWFNNLPNGCSQEEFKAFASKAGAITSVEFGGRNRMAWVTYGSPKSVANAVGMAGQDFGGRPVAVEASTRDPLAPKERKPRREAAAPAAEGAVHNDRLIVRNLPEGITSEALTALFSKSGAVTEARPMRNRMALVAFAAPDAASKALASLNNSNVTAGANTSAITLEWAKVQPARAPKAAKPAAAAGGAAGGAPRAASTRTPEAVRVAVTGYPAGTTQDELKALFASAGRITTVRIAKSGETGIIGFEEAAAGDKALKMSGSSYKGGKITVELALRQPGAQAEAKAGRKRTSGDDDEEGKPAGGAARAPVDLSTIVWVGNIKGAAVTAEDVRKQFSHYGAIAEGAKAVQVTNMSKADASYAYITYTDKAAADKACADDGKEGMKIEHAKAKPTGRRRVRRSPREEA